MMWPWGHLAVGYLLSVGWRQYTDADPESMLVVLLAVAIGTQCPDLIDKPLAWSVSVLPTGRTLAHSMFVAVPVAIGAHRLWHTYGDAFAIGYLSHLGADAFWPLLGGQFRYLSFLLWPVLPSPTYTIAPSFSAHLAHLTATPSVLIEIGLFVVAIGHWLATGRPGLAQLTTVCRRVS